MDADHRVTISRQRAGIKTHKELASRCGVKASTLSRVVHGARPGEDLWPLIGARLGVNHEWLRWGDPDKAPEWHRNSDEKANDSPVKNQSAIGILAAENDRLRRQVQNLTEDLDAARSALSTLAQRLGTPQERPPQGDETPANGGQPPEAPSSGNQGRRTG